MTDLLNLKATHFPAICQWIQIYTFLNKGFSTKTVFSSTIYKYVNKTYLGPFFPEGIIIISTLLNYYAH